jgi:hypothetical protein
MEHIEMYWEVLSCVVGIVCIGITGCLFCRLVNPFLKKRKNAIAVGVTYFASMLVMYFIPYEMEGMTAYAIGTLMSFMVMYFLERRNIEQKVFLAVVMYLLNWISKGIALVPRNFLLKMIDASNFISSRQILLFGCYAVEEIFYVMLIFLLMAFLIRMIDKVYSVVDGGTTIVVSFPKE